MLTSTLVKEMEFQQLAVDHSVYFRRSEDEHTIIAVATDDIALTLKRATVIL
jgi:hypothetical protein